MVKKRIHEYNFTNGFKLLVKEDHRSPIAVSHIVYKVGSSYEHNGLTGISHVVEHMMFRGSKNYNSKRFFRSVSESGGNQNAFTREDYTGYYQSLHTQELLDAFKFEADRMNNLLLREKDFAKEIQIVMEERRLRVNDDPYRSTLERFIAVGCVSSPYHHPAIGWMNDLENMTISDVKNWYRTWYAPNNAIAIVVGDVKPENIYKMALKYFGRLKPSTLPILKPQREINPTGIRSVTVETKTGLPWFLLGYNTPVLNTTDAHWKPYALLMLCEILAGGDSARLQQEIVRGREIALNIGYHYSPFYRQDNLLYFHMMPAKGRTIEEVKESLINQINALHHTLPDKVELDRIKVRIIATKSYDEDSILNQAQEIGAFEAVGLSWREIHRAYRIIESITPKQISEVAREFLTNNRLIIAELRPHE